MGGIIKLKELYLLEQKESISEYLRDKEFANKRSKEFLYHGTSIHPEKFKLTDDWDGDSGNVYETDLPEGFLFLTNNIREANAYGRYIIPCEFKYNSKLVVKVNSSNPSREFDDDFSGYGNYGMWSKFWESGKDILQVKGYDRSTFITSIENIIPRVDLAKEFYRKER